jgi:hypothetical protein
MSTDGPARALRGIPASALWPGLAGLLPFLACALLPLATDPAWHPLLQRALVAYAAVILAFVGAIHWGIGLMASRDDDAGQVPRAAAATASVAAGRFAWSVVPALWGWLAMFPSFVSALAMLGIGFIVQLAVDWRVAGALQLPAWYLALRLVLTSGVLLALLLASLATALLA